MSNSQRHVPETAPSEQLEMGIDRAKSLSATDPIDQSAIAAEWVQESLDLTPLEMAYSALTLLEQNSPEMFVTQHWLEDASIQPQSLIEVLYERTLRNLIRQNISRTSGATLEYEQTQPTSLEEYPAPEESFAELVEQSNLSAVSDEDIRDILVELTQGNQWPDIVILRHVLYLTDEVGVNPADTSLSAQLSHAPPSDQLLPFVLTSLLYHLTGEAIQSDVNALTA